MSITVEPQMYTIWFVCQKCKGNEPTYVIWIDGVGICAKHPLERVFIIGGSYSYIDLSQTIK